MSYMSRVALLHQPVRFHVTLEKKNLDELKKKAQERSKNLTEIFRDLVESYLNGTIFLPTEPVSEVVDRIRKFKSLRQKTKIKSELVIRNLRDHGS